MSHKKMHKSSFIKQRIRLSNKLIDFLNLLNLMIQPSIMNHQHKAKR